MTSTAATVLRQKLAELQAQSRKAWAGLEREAVIEHMQALEEEASPFKKGG